MYMFFLFLGFVAISTKKKRRREEFETQKKNGDVFSFDPKRMGENENCAKL